MAQDAAPALTDLGKVNILLVDDEVRNLDVLESLLQAPDYNLVRALTAERALMELLNGEFAAIVLDIQMPEMSGIELANLIKQRKRTQHIPIIFLTAYFQEDKDVLQGYGTGAVDYLTKPVNPQILKSKIAVFVDLFRKTQALATTNAALEQEVAQRQRAEEALRQTNNELETHVQARTADLVRVNEELRERESALRQSEAQALAASRAKDDFLARLSHELRTPLNPVLLLASDAASNPALPKEIRSDFETIAKHVTLEARLIDDLLDLTRISRGKLALDLRPVDVHVVMNEALAMIQADLSEKRIVWTLELSAPHSVVMGDDVRLKQIFWNVLKNAVKFTPNAGQITARSRLDGGNQRLVVEVSDTGIGLTHAEIGRIFETFSQGDHAVHGVSHRFGGMGLGLAISRMLAELHAGSITASSPGSGQGSTFTIELPLLAEAYRLQADAASSSPATPELRAERNGHPPRRILLVEDHKATSNALTQLLIHRNYDVVSASCLNEARAIANQQTFDLLISDIGLPDGNGYELMSELHGRHGLIGIALTGYGMDEDVNRSRQAGFVAHLTKPVSVQALDGALATLATR